MEKVKQETARMKFARHILAIVREIRLSSGYESVYASNYKAIRRDHAYHRYRGHSGLIRMARLAGYDLAYRAEWMRHRGFVDMAVRRIMRSDPSMCDLARRVRLAEELIDCPEARLELVRSQDSEIMGL